MSASFKDTVVWTPPPEAAQLSRAGLDAVIRDASPKHLRKKTLVSEDASSEWVRRLIAMSASSVVSEWYALGTLRFFLWIIQWRFIGPSLNVKQRQRVSQMFFGLSLFLRPLGAILIGHVADSRSRIQALSISLILSTFAMTALPLIPSYEEIGGLASILAILTQVISGLAVGGQLPGAYVAMYEAAPHGQKIYSVALMQLQAMGGMLLAAIVSVVFDTFVRFQKDKASIILTYWKAPFFFTAVLALPGLSYLRSLNLAEQNRNQAKRDSEAVLMASSHSWKQSGDVEGSFSTAAAPPAASAPLKELCSKHLGTCLLVMFATFLQCNTAWLMFGWWQERAPLRTVGAITGFLVLAPFAAHVLDSPGAYGLPASVTPKRVIALSAFAVGIFAPIAFSYIAADVDSGQTGASAVAQAAGGASGGPTRELMAFNGQMSTIYLTVLSILCAVSVAPLPAFLCMQFPQQVRFSGVAIGWGAAQMLFASTAGSIASEIEYTYGIAKIGHYISLSGFITALAVSFLRATEAPSGEPQVLASEPSPAGDTLQTASPMLSRLTMW